MHIKHNCKDDENSIGYEIYISTEILYKKKTVVDKAVKCCRLDKIRYSLYPELLDCTCTNACKNDYTNYYTF